MPSPDFTEYVDLTPLNIDPADIYIGAIELARLTMPEFTLRQGTPEDAIFQAMSYMSGLTVGAVNRMPSRLMVGLANLLGYSRFQGSRATIEATVTLASYDGATIPAGTIFGWTYEDALGDFFQYAFELTENLDIAATDPALLILPSGTASLRSMIPGFLPTIASGVSLSVLTTNTSISTIITTNTFTNGLDPDTDFDYLTALTTHIESLSSNFSTATQVQSSILSNYRNVTRCRVYDLTDPSGSLLVSAPAAPGYFTIFVYGQDRQMTASERTSIEEFVEGRINASLISDVYEFRLCGVSVRADMVYDNRYAESDVSETLTTSIQEYLSPSAFPLYETKIRATSVLANAAKLDPVLYVNSCYLQPIGDSFVEKQWADVRAATTPAIGNITISTALNNGDTLDGVTLVTGDRVLVKNQTTQSENGIYVVGTSPARATDADATADFSANKLVRVNSGTVNAGTYWQQSGSVATLGSSNVVFASGVPYETLEFLYKGSLPDSSLGAVSLTLTGAAT